MENQQTVIIDDTTLRDGEQSAGVAFSLDEKILIASHLDGLGIQELEVGIPAMGREEQESIRAITDLDLNAKLMVWSRMHARDIQLCRGIPVDMIDLSIPVSDQQIYRKIGQQRSWVIQQIKNLVPKAVDMGLGVCVGGEDASRADKDFLRVVVETAQEAGARRFRFADTVGIMEPFGVYETIKQLYADTDLELEMHAHDDLGMATANTLAAARAGASHVNTTVHGLGERAGNAPLEEVVVALKHHYGIETSVELSNYSAVSRLVSEASGRPVAWSKSLVGEGVFTHEAGIHVDGMLKDVSNYQGVDPSIVGRKHTLILGKHSGSSAVIQAYAEAGIALTQSQADRLLGFIRNYVTEHKKQLDSRELEFIYLRMFRESHRCQVH